jgi:hypothetical protein
MLFSTEESSTGVFYLKPSIRRCVPCARESRVSQILDDSPLMQGGVSAAHPR